MIALIRAGLDNPWALFLAAVVFAVLVACVDGLLRGGAR